jgi:LysM repeat protein
LTTPNSGTFRKSVIPVSSQHTVVPGQTINDIARVHNVNPADIMNHPNNRHLTFAGPLTPGTRLFLPPKPMSVI